jgi:hypothetical protein
MLALAQASAAISPGWEAVPMAAETKALLQLHNISAAVAKRLAEGLG